VGDAIDIQFTFNSFYWGTHIVTTTSPGSFTYSAPSCSQPSQATPGFTNYELAVIEDNGQDNEFRNIYQTFGANPYDKTWSNGIVIYNDQHVIVDHWFMDGHGNCNANYCGSVIYAPGSFTNGPAVLELSNLSINPGCSMNGITAYNGNTTSVSDSVIQGYPMWGYRGGTQRGGFGGVIFKNLYEEVGACTNPFYTPNQQTGVDQYGQTVTWHGGEGALGTMPSFAGGGATTYAYYLVVKDSGGNQSAPLYIGSATPSGTGVTVNWPRVQDVNTTTYDLLRSTGPDAPSTGNCAGGSTVACGSVTTGQAQCSTLQCSFTDNVSVATSSYSVLLPDFSGSGIGGAIYSPTFQFFPGGFILQNSATLNFQGGNIFGQNINQAGGIMASNGIGPVATDAGGVTPSSYIRIFSSRSGPVGGSMFKIFDPTNGGVLTANQYGPLAFLNPVPSTSGHSYANGQYLITYATPNSPQVIASASPRTLVASANDSGLGFDVAGNNPAVYQTGYSSPVAHSFYIGSYLDNLSWKLRINGSGTEFNTPAQFDTSMNSILGCSGCSPFSRFAGTTDNFPGSSLSGNWTLLEGTFSVSGGLVTLATTGGADSRAYAYYNATTPTSDVFAVFRSYIGTSGTRVMTVCVRASTVVPATGYCAGPVANGPNFLQLMKITGVAGYTSLCNIPFPATNGSWSGISAIGSQITLYLNGAPACSATDTTYTSGSVALMGSNAASQQSISNLTFFNAGWTESEGLQLKTLAPSTLVDGATITWNLTNFSMLNSTVTLGGNRTLALTNPQTGGNYVLRIVQDATGGRTLTLGSGCTWKVINGGGGTITLTAAANAVDILAFYYDGTNCYATLGANYN